MILKVPVLVGLETRLAQIDAQVSLGLGGFQIIGSCRETERFLPEAALRESKVRVAAALATRVVYLVGSVDVALPAGASLCELDLAIALACLEAIGLVQLPDGLFARAELALDGTLRPVPGTFTALTSEGCKRVSVAVVSRHDRLEAKASGANFIAHQSLADVASAFVPHKVEPYAVNPPDFSQIPKMDAEACAKVRAAALEGRSILLQGRPGSGMTMMARYYHSFLTLTPAEAIEVMRIQSAGCVLDAERFKVPFRAPHHSVSEAGMLGGGGRPRPGEVSLAHHGVLMLDELPEFRSAVLAAVAQARTRGYVDIAREGAHVRFPSRCRIVATAMLCPRNCRGACDCPGPSLERYRERLALVGELEVIRLP